MVVQQCGAEDDLTTHNILNLAVLPAKIAAIFTPFSQKPNDTAELGTNEERVSLNYGVCCNKVMIRSQFDIENESLAPCCLVPTVQASGGTVV